MNYSQESPIVRLNNILCINEGNRVLENISLQLYKGKIHAVVGDHGSGKSYISDILSGVCPASRGSIFLDDQKVSSINIKKAQDWGIQTIHQDVSLINNFTIAENMFTPGNRNLNLPFNKSRIIQESAEILKTNNININPERLYKDLHLSEKILISVIRALLRSPRLLILDEALEKLSGNDFKLLKNILRKHLNQGMSILCLSHKIDDVYNFADYVSIIRQGQIFLTDSMDNMDRINLIKLCYSQMNNDNFTDISKEFYQLLKYNEAILQKLPINLIVTDDQSRIKLVNDSGKKYFKTQSRDFRGHRLNKLFGEENSSMYTILLNALESPIETAHYNIPFALYGERRIVNFRTFPIYDGAFLIGNIVILEDISEQEKLREQINLSEKLASVGLLAAGVAHEINNPLEIIYNHLNYLEMGTIKEEKKEVIREIVEELNDIKSIVSNLISFSDNNNASVEIYSLNDLVKSLINLIRFNATRNEIIISLENRYEEIMIKTSKNEMKQVLLNLFKNSFEAMPSGGNILIACDKIIKNQTSYAQIILEDSGSGLETQNPGDIFLPFYTTKKSAKDNNLGLGLSVIYGIIKKYNGEISAQNREGGGCSFIITIPMID